ncbi:unnamed protein product [Camellia sinensis]
MRKVVREAASGGRDAEHVKLKLEIKVEVVDYDKKGLSCVYVERISWRMNIVKAEPIQREKRRAAFPSRRHRSTHTSPFHPPSSGGETERPQELEMWLPLPVLLLKPRDISSTIKKKKNVRICSNLWPKVHICAPTHNYDLEEEDHFYNDGFRTLTSEEVQMYTDMVNQSEGFDAPNLADNLYVCCLILPLNENSQNFEETKSCSISATAEYNAHRGTHYEFLKVLKANVQFITCDIYYITFETQLQAADSDPEIFEARVLAGVNDITVYFCRLK